MVTDLPVTEESVSHSEKLVWKDVAFKAGKFGTGSILLSNKLAAIA